MNSVDLGSLCRPRQWPVVSQKQMNGGGFPVFGANGQIGWFTEFTHSDETIAVGCRGSCGEVHLVPPRSYINGNAMALDELDESRVDRRFLFRWLRHRGFRDVISGTSQPQIIQANIRRVDVPLPPLPEQKRIAATLDQADDIRRKRAGALERLNALAGAIFREMFEASEYPTRSLAEAGRVITGSTPPTNHPEYFGGDVPFVTPGDLESGSSVKRTLTAEGALKSRTVGPGSALVCCIGATIGKMDIARRTSSFNQQINAVEWFEDIDPIFGFFSMRLLREQIIFRGKGASTTLPILKKSEFQKLRIAIPPLNRQRDFTLRVTEVEAIRIRMEQSLLESRALFASLEHRAFRGDL